MCAVKPRWGMIAWTLRSAEADILRPDFHQAHKFEVRDRGGMGDEGELTCTQVDVVPTVSRVPIACVYTLPFGFVTLVASMNEVIAVDPSTHLRPPKESSERVDVFWEWLLLQSMDDYCGTWTLWWMVEEFLTITQGAKPSDRVVASFYYQAVDAIGDLWEETYQELLRRVASRVSTVHVGGDAA